MSQLTVNTLQLGQSATPANNFVLAMPSPQDGTIKLSRGNVGSTTQDVISVNAAGQVSFPATGSFGKILQLVSTTKTNIFTTNSNSTPVAVTGLSATITPSQATNKILVTGNVVTANGGDGATSDGYPQFVYLYRDGSLVTGAIGDASASYVRSMAGQFFPGTGGAAFSSTNHPINYLDAPATTAATTYAIYVKATASTSSSVVVNKSNGAESSPQGYWARVISTITVMEIAA